MDFPGQMIQYYQGESHHGLFGALIGLLLLVSGLFLWKLAGPLSIWKGLMLPMFIFGLIVGLGGAADHYFSRKSLPAKILDYHKNKQAFVQQELQKAEKTHRSWFGIRMFWGALSFAGLVLALAAGKNYWTGVGLGTLVLGMITLTGETFSMKFNERYHQAVISAAGQKPPEITAGSNQATIEQHTTTKASVMLKRTPAEMPDTLSKDIPAAAMLSAVKTMRDSIPIPDTLHTVRLAEEDIAVKTSKFRYNYPAHPICTRSLSTRKCWFSKKYIKE